MVADGSDYAPDSVPDQEVTFASRQLGSRQAVEDEIDATLDCMNGFWNQEPDHVMRSCAALSARMTELSVLLHRAETKDKQYHRVRTMQVERVLAELDRQFRISSRLLEVRRQDLYMAGAAT